MTTNQIKQKEIQLKDSTGCAWVVGYCSVPKDETTLTKVEYGITSDIYDYYTPTLADWDFKQYVSSGTATVKFVKKLNFTFYCEHENQPQPGYIVETVYASKFNKDGKISYTETMTSGHDYMSSTLRDPERIYETISQNNTLPLYNTALSYYGLTDDVGLYATLQQFAQQGEKAKRLKVGDGATAEYYTIKLVATPQNQIGKTPNEDDDMYDAWVAWCQAINNESGKNLISSSYNKNSFAVDILSDNFHIELVPSTPYNSLDFDWPIDRKCLIDAPYCMFCMPYGKISIISDETNDSFDTIGENALSVASGIATSLGANLYDIQLLPYAPLPSLRNSTYPDVINFKKAPFSSLVKDKDYVLLNNSKQIVIFCETSQDSFTIPVSYRMEQFTALDFKAHSLTDMVRLCSPNYNGVFEFSPYKNRGFNYVKVDYTYKPFQPYIHLAPDFGGLYGQDFNDARGLICGGDFSLPTTADAWKNYQIQNKTYQEQFNRQIENMEVQHKYAREHEKWAVISGVASGAVSGAGMGAMGLNSPYGALAGVATGALSLAGGLADMRINEALRTEALDLTKDQFGFQLENIKALPNSLTRISALNANNKIFPFVEVYTCTEAELTAVYNKLIYNGFTIGRIDTLENLIINKPSYMGRPGYFKGQIIRLEDIGDDFHVSNAIATELYKGVYI